MLDLIVETSTLVLKLLYILVTLVHIIKINTVRPSWAW